MDVGKDLQRAFDDGYNKALDDFVETVKPIIDEKIKGWTNSDDLRRWCARAVDKTAKKLKETEIKF